MLVELEFGIGDVVALKANSDRIGIISSVLVFHNSEGEMERYYNLKGFHQRFEENDLFLVQYSFNMEDKIVEAGK